LRARANKGIKACELISVLWQMKINNKFGAKKQMGKLWEGSRDNE
jgi:hypothetical protein